MANLSPHAGMCPIAVFDFDGTCIGGQSGSILSWWLFFRGRLSPKTAFRLGLWGARYKLRLPMRQEQPRELIFDEIKGLGHEQVDRMLVEFHREKLIPAYRKAAQEEIARRRQEGCRTVLVSATFAPIAHEAMKRLSCDGYVATNMEQNPDGSYTGRVLGDVVEGAAKFEALRSWADAEVGEGQWYVAYAYGDHHSDVDLLSRADHPVAVNADWGLRHVARSRGWDQQNWNRRP